MGILHTDSVFLFFYAGDCVVNRGVGLKLHSVLLHKVILYHEIVRVEVVFGQCCQLKLPCAELSHVASVYILHNL